MTGPFADSTRVQSETRSFAVPVVLAVLALIAAVLIAMHFFPATSVGISSVKTELYSGDVTFKADSIVLGQDQTTHVLFVAATVRVDNQLRAPIVVDDFTLTFTDASGAELVAHAPLASELPKIEVTYPALKALMRAPLARETSIDAGKAAEGAVLFSLEIPRALWDERKSAVVSAQIYHQPAASVTLPKS